MEFKDKKDQKEFEEWAFGETPVAYNVAAMHSWNSFHGELYFIKENELVGESLEKMFTLWKKHGKDVKKPNSKKRRRSDKE